MITTNQMNKNLEAFRKAANDLTVTVESFTKAMTPTMDMLSELTRQSLAPPPHFSSFWVKVWNYTPITIKLWYLRRSMF